MVRIITMLNNGTEVIVEQELASQAIEDYKRVILAIDPLVTKEETSQPPQPPLPTA